MRSYRTIATCVAAAAATLVFAVPASADTLYGGAGGDLITGSWGNDLIVGYGGNDELYGSWGDDTMNGGIGNDYVHGGPGNDVVNGADGNDVLVTGFDNVVDTVYCGWGWDTAYLRNGDRAYGCETIYRS